MLSDVPSAPRFLVDIFSFVIHAEFEVGILAPEDFHFTNYRFSFHKLQILISQTTDFHFVLFHFVSQITVSRQNLNCHWLQKPKATKVPFVTTVKLPCMSTKLSTGREISHVALKC